MFSAVHSMSDHAIVATWDLFGIPGIPLSVLCLVWFQVCCNMCCQKQNMHAFRETNAHVTTHDVLRFHYVSCHVPILWCWGMHLIYMSPRRLKVNGGWAGVPIENFVFAPPSFLVSLPSANTGIRSNRCETYVKPMWTLSTWQRCEAQSYVWCAAGATFGLPLDCQSGKQMLLRIVPASFISTFFIFTCLCIAERERVSVVVVGSLMFWVYMFYVYFI